MKPYIALYGIAGYKGNMIDAPHYILILSEKKPHYIEKMLVTLDKIQY